MFGNACLWVAYKKPRFLSPSSLKHIFSIMIVKNKIEGNLKQAFHFNLKKNVRLVLSNFLLTRKNMYLISWSLKKSENSESDYLLIIELKHSIMRFFKRIWICFIALLAFSLYFFEQSEKYGTISFELTVLSCF